MFDIVKYCKIKILVCFMLAINGVFRKFMTTQQVISDNAELEMPSFLYLEELPII